MLELTNTLTGKKEPFTPLEKGKVKMYVCGPTVYGLTHIGNARAAVFFDVVRRFLEFSGYQVKFVSNYTDVDDKIINRAREEREKPDELAERFILEYVKDMKSLGVRPPTVSPKVTETIPQILRFIEGLIEKGFGYEVGGEVFYSIRKFKEYGKLSGKNIDDLRVGARVLPGEQKKDPLDFSLWKPQKSADEPAWQSPWGMGRPGWHIECSAMAMEYLGETFDIHGGGIDLTHPHHENEIAQSEGRNGKPLARVWLHNNLLNIGNEKMSKSLGNIFVTRDFVAQYSAETLKFLLLSSHYRSPIDFSERHIRDTEAALHRFYTTLNKCLETSKLTGESVKPSPEETTILETANGFLPKVQEAMEDDLNTAKVVGYLFEYVRALNAYLDKKGFKLTQSGVQIAKLFCDQIITLSSFLNLFGEDPALFLKALRERVLRSHGMTSQDVETRIEERLREREKKNFKAADAIRDKLATQGVLLKDSPKGTEWDVDFSLPPRG